MFSIQELFFNQDQYIIPLYQRNYAWEQFHLQQLIQDIWDSCLHAPERNYYIGTLVVYHTPQGLYEIVDGQQRLTTINILLCAMQNEIEDKDVRYSWFKGVNLTYQFRENASFSLKKLYEHIDPSNIEDVHIKRMYEYVKPTMESVFSQNMSANTSSFIESFKKFKEYFLNHVIITRVMLPPDTDLNHYFEIMNTRGEQLEKHEILKARILNVLKNEPDALWLGNRIWEACADMNRYVQMGFTDTKLRQLIFSDNLNTPTALDFDTLVQATKQCAKEEKRSLFSILEINKNEIQTDENSAVNSRSATSDELRFNSVINFPNFLLQVLRVMTKDDIALDDKRLLEIFEPKKINTTFAKKFLYQLLKLRFLFDKYIIKRDFMDDNEDGKWNILKVEVYEKNYNYNNSFGKNQQKNIMIQSMFHVSLPSQNYKHWLCAALLYLSEHNDGEGLYDYLNGLSHAYMLDRFIQSGEDQLDYFSIIFKNNGIPAHHCPKKLILPRFDTNIDIFYFNYLDMQLWLNGFEQDFLFTARSSVEHFYPQHPMENFEEMDPIHLHSFGNLCLISNNKNSKLSNFSPIQKTDFYKKSTIDSIKQKIMMDKCEKKRDWTTHDIDEHANAMEQVLIKSLTA